MMNVHGNCCERLAVTLFYGAKALSANVSVPKSAKGYLVAAKKKQNPNLAQHILLKYATRASK